MIFQNATICQWRTWDEQAFRNTSIKPSFRQSEADGNEAEETIGCIWLNGTF
jgi:hypothetical protein